MEFAEEEMASQFTASRTPAVNESLT